MAAFAALVAIAALHLVIAAAVFLTPGSNGLYGYVPALLTVVFALAALRARRGAAVALLVASGVLLMVVEFFLFLLWQNPLPHIT